MVQESSQLCLIGVCEESSLCIRPLCNSDVLECPLQLNRKMSEIETDASEKQVLSLERHQLQQQSEKKIEDQPRSNNFEPIRSQASKVSFKDQQIHSLTVKVLVEAVADEAKDGAEARVSTVNSANLRKRTHDDSWKISDSESSPQRHQIMTRSRYRKLNSQKDATQCNNYHHKKFNRLSWRCKSPCKIRI